MLGLAGLAVALGLALVPAALASHPSTRVARQTNLDGDAALETVIATHIISFDHKRQRAEVVALDDCAGERRTYELAPAGRWMFPRAIRGSRVLGRPGVLFTIHYEDGHVIARLSRLRVQQRGECPTPSTPFDYSSATPLVAPPRGYLIAGIDVSVTDDSKRYSGRELLLTESYAEGTSRPVRAKRLTYFRYRLRTRMYERYRMVLIQA